MVTPMEGLAEPELKVRDTSYSAQVINDTGFVDILNGMVRGSDYSNRIGRQIYMMRLSGNLYSRATDTTGLDQIHRFMVVYDNQVNGVMATFANIMTSANVFDHPLLNYRRRFEILYDEMFCVNAAGESGSHQCWRIDVPINKLVTYNSGNAGTEADIATGALYWVYIGSRAAGATAGVFSAKLRLCFNDC